MLLLGFAGNCIPARQQLFVWRCHLLRGQQRCVDVCVDVRGQRRAPNAVANQGQEENAFRVGMASVDLVQIVGQHIRITVQLCHLQGAGAKVHVHDFQLHEVEKLLSNVKCERQEVNRATAIAVKILVKFCYDNYSFC